MSRQVTFKMKSLSVLCCLLFSQFLMCGCKQSSSDGLPVNTCPSGSSNTFDGTGLSLELFAGAVSTSGTADGTGTAAKFYKPQGMYVASNGDVYVADQYNDAIRKITSAGVVTTFASSLIDPTDLYPDSTGNLYVVSNEATLTRKITPAGIVSTFNSDLGRSLGIVIDSSDMILGTGFSSNRVRKVSLDGVTSDVYLGQPPSGYADGNGTNARFSAPAGIAIDSSDNLFIADYNNNTIRKVNASGDVTTLAGTAGVKGYADCNGTDAKFNNPIGIDVDVNGNVYVADTQNAVVRRITPAGVVTTIAGVYGVHGFAAGPLPGQLYYPAGVAVRGNTLYISTGHAIAVIRNLP